MGNNLITFFMTTRFFLLACLGFIPWIVSCGGSHGWEPDSVPLSGYWNMYILPEGSTDEKYLDTYYLKQTDTTISGLQLSGSNIHHRVTMTWQQDHVKFAFTGTISSTISTTQTPNLITGTYVHIEGGTNIEQGSFRLVKVYLAAGSLILKGVLLNQPVNVQTYSLCFGARPTTSNDLEVRFLDENNVLAILFPNIERLFQGLFQAAVVPERSTELEVILDLFLPAAGLMGRTHAISGTVTITRYDTTKIAGTFALIFNEGYVSGGFNVPIQQWPPE